MDKSDPSAGATDPEAVPESALDAPDTERLLARLHERSAIIDGALDGIVVIDDTGIVQEFNKAAEAMFGYDRDEAIGAPIVELIIPDVHRAQHEAGFEAYVAGKSNAQMIGNRIETEARRKCGATFPVELTIIETAGTDRPVFAGYLRDLTRRRAMEAEMKRQSEEIHQSEKLGAMGALLANVAHELNNPLSVVVGQAELMCEQRLDETMERYSQRILAAANRSTEIVRTLLAAVRQKPPVLKAFKADTPLVSSVALVEHAYESAGVDLKVEIEENLPNLFGDEVQIGQVLANLLTNAEHAATAGGKVIASVSYDSASASMVYAVGDNGPGVDDDMRVRIFEPFFTTKEEGAGTGVGLAIAHNVATAHSGTLTVGRHGELGGALFELVIPVGDAANGDAVVTATPQHALQTGSIRVLVVDDDIDVADTIVELLDMEGIEADVANSGYAALERMSDMDYALILSDLRMPGMDGAAFFKQAEALWPDSDRRFGFITGDGLNSAAASFLKDANVPVIEKPVTRDSLRSLLQKVTERSRLGR